MKNHGTGRRTNYLSLWGAWQILRGKLAVTKLPGSHFVVGSRWFVLARLFFHLDHLGVSKNSGTPKSSILTGFSIIFTIHFGVPLFLETPNWRMKDFNPPGPIGWRSPHSPCPPRCNSNLQVPSICRNQPTLEELQSVLQVATAVEKKNNLLLIRGYIPMLLSF